MMRVGLFIITNLLVVLVIGIILRLLGVDQFLVGSQLNIPSLLVFSLVVGFTGSFISLLMSKPMAKLSTGARVITMQTAQYAQERFLIDTVHQLAERAGIGHPEVAIYEGAPNAFATGAFKNDALVAVSTGLLETMTEEEVVAVLAHEVAHIANGDMVTMTLIQGVMNTFVVFFSRVAGFLVDSFLSKNSEREGSSMGPAYWITSIVCQIVFGILASIVVAWFSRQREFRADAGASSLLGSSQPMIAALKRLKSLQAGALPESVAALGISESKGLFELFSTHPPLDERIRALQ